MASFHALFTVVLLLIFIGIVIWAYSPRRKTAFDEAARLPFADEPANPSILDEAQSELSGETRGAASQRGENI